MQFHSLRIIHILLLKGPKALACVVILLLLGLLPVPANSQAPIDAKTKNLETFPLQDTSMYTPEIREPDEFDVPAIATEQPGGVAERVYFHYENPEVALRSYAAADVNGCSGTFIGPNVMMTAGHCGQGNRNATFRLYTAAATQITEPFSCQYLTHSFADTDLNLYWCSANAQGENPGDKYGYLDFDIVVDPVTGFDYTASRNLLINGTALYSIWMNPINSIGGGWHSIYSQGAIDNLNYSSWYTPNTYTGTGYLCGNSECVGGLNPGQNCDTGACGQACNGGTCTARPSRAIAAHTDLWTNPGASGSSQIRRSSNRILVGPLSVGCGDCRGRSSLSIADYLWWAITDANLTCPTCCLSCVSDQVNTALLTNLGITNPAAYYGWVDGNLDGLFDVQQDLEQLTGENARDWYWLGFESYRRNELWTKHPPAVATFDISDPTTGIASLSTLGQTVSGYIPVLSHQRLNLSSGDFYRITFMTYVTQAQESTPLRVCLEGTELHCADSNPPVGTWATHVVRLWASSNPTLRFELKKATQLYLVAVSVISDTETMDFDSHDKRYPWRNHNTGERGLIWPNGKASATQADWAGVAYRDTSEPMDDDWSLRSRQLAIDGGAEYRVCFEHRNSARDPLTGNIQGKVRMLNEFGEIPTSTILFSPGSNWQQNCTSWFYVPTDDNNLQFGVRAWESLASGAYLVDNIEIERRGAIDVYVDWRNLGFREEGTPTYPYSTVLEGLSAVRDGGEVHIADGQYPEKFTVQKPTTLRATGGSVVIGE